jgi:Ca-activated chloride channel family protein
MIARLAPALVGLGAVLSGGAPSPAQEAPTDAEVNQSISRGLKSLREHQEPDGRWRFSFNQNHDLGITALAGLALLENGVDRDDPAVRKADGVVRELALGSDRTYDLALAILFLARIEPGSRGPDDELIRRLGRRLAGGQRAGMWSYTVPKEETDPEGGSRSGSSRPPGPLERILSGGGGDNSNTQFALLGIWAASRHGLDANESLEAIDRHFRATQNPAGDWGYTPGSGGGQAMTCAGLMGLSIAAARPKQAERQTARARGAALAADPAFTKALRVVGRDAKGIGRGSDIYHLWSVERVCVALGLRQLDGLDWYAKGARELLDRQRGDGSWPESQWGSLPDTCLALLFLRKANLAFELDRVLKLPGPDRPDPVAGSAAAAALPDAPNAPGRGGGDEDVTVAVRGADEKTFPLITLDFEVKRPDGTPLVDARAEDFRVTEYDRPVEVLRFQSPRSTETRPTTVVLVVDRSLSMEEEDRIGALKAAVGTFLEVIPAGSRVAVIAFGSEVEVLCPFTGDRQRVRAAVNGLRPAGATRYYDAVAEALELIARESGRRAILALTDGEDTFSQAATLDSVILAARRAGLPIHTLGLGSEDEIESAALRRLATETRGQYFPARQADQLRAIYEELAKGLGSSYSLSYKTDRPLPDGTLRPVRIYYRASRKAGEAAVFIRGMVVPAAGWSRLFLALLGGLAALALLPGWWTRRTA